MEVLHRAESGFYRLAKVIEEAGEGESKKVLIEYVWERFIAFTDPQMTDILVVVLPRYIACNQQAHRHYYCDLGQNHSDNKCKIVKGKVIGGGWVLEEKIVPCIVVPGIE